MPWVKVWIHFVWSTKNREPFLNDEIRQRVFQHIRENAKEKDIHLDFINGFVDHVHCLISLGTDQTLEKIMQLIKGESSFWVNKQQLVKNKFEWQDEYIALSVSYSALDKVRAYILNQEEHHKKKTFTDEYEEFLSAHQFEIGLAKANSEILKQPTT